MKQSIGHKSDMTEDEYVAENPDVDVDASNPTRCNESEGKALCARRVGGACPATRHPRLVQRTTDEGE
jgi:hypothetical protein